MRYVFEYFVRQEFQESAEFNPPKDLGFFFKGWEIVLILFGYFFAAGFGFLLVLKYSKKVINN